MMGAGIAYVSPRPASASSRDVTIEAAEGQGLLGEAGGQALERGRTTRR